MAITFGTDGWRAVIADGFTFDRVRRAARATARYLQWDGRRDLPVYHLQHAENAAYPSPFRPASAGVVVGYDTRFLSERFARVVAEEMAALGVPVWLSREFAPTPAFSLAVRDRQAAAAVIITASHNPPEYNGYKLKPEYASSGLPEVMSALTRFVEREPDGPQPAAGAPAPITPLEPFPGYAAEVERLVDVQRLKAADMELFVDAMHGAGQGYAPRLLDGGRCTVREVRGTLDPRFGGVNPEPIGRNLDALAQAIRGGAPAPPRIGVALDGDADRVGAMDADGRFYNSHEIFAILLWHLVERRGWKGGVVKTFSTSVMVELLAQRYGLPVHETPVGFKYVVEHMLADDILMGGEESGGIGVRGHIPERDGILSGLLLAEAAAWEGDSLPALLERIHQMVGSFAYDRLDLHLESRALMETFMERLRAHPPQRLDGRRVADVLTLDGVKCVREDRSWLLFRPSGTEPVLRIYAEAGSMQEVRALLEEGQQMATAAGA